MRTCRCRAGRHYLTCTPLVRWGLLVALGLAAMGCGGPRRVEVAGEVTFQGVPIPAGRIYFNPDFMKGNDGPQGWADIHDGKFDTRKGGKGACGGPTIALIQGHEASKQAVPGWVGDPLFKEFQVAIDLPGRNCTQNFDVPAAAAEGLQKDPPGTPKP